MPNTPHDTVDDAAFLAELENFDGSLGEAVTSARQPERIDLLDKAFAFTRNDAVVSQPYHAFGALRVFDDVNGAIARAESSVPEASHDAPRRAARHNDAPALAVVLVFVMGLAAGASAAAIVFYDRAAQIVAAWTAPQP